jgi:hypothetical protein
MKEKVMGLLPLSKGRRWYALYFYHIMLAALGKSDYMRAIGKKTFI